MHAIKARYTNGQFVPEGPFDLPDGCEVLIEPLNTPSETLGISESEWGDSPADLADWDAWIGSIEPFEYTEEERAAFREFDEKMKQFNLDAVRRQMGLDRQ